MRKIQTPIWPAVPALEDSSVEAWMRKLLDVLDVILKEASTGTNNLVTKTAAYTLDQDDDVVLANGTFTLTLPRASTTNRRVYYVKNIGSGAITVDGAGSETIDEATTFILAAQYDAVTVISDGTEWWII